MLSGLVVDEQMHFQTAYVHLINLSTLVYQSDREYILLQVLNITEIELNRVDIRVGLSGGLYFMDGSPQAVRQLRDLNSQVKLHMLPSFSHMIQFNPPRLLHLYLLNLVSYPKHDRELEGQENG